MGARTGVAKCARVVLLAALFAGSALAQESLETLTVTKLPPANAHRVYVPDLALSHIVDGKLHVVDGDTLKYLGLIATGYAGQTTLSPDRKELYVATTYYSRLNRGERFEVVDTYDTATLAHTGEIAIPPKHAQALNYKGTLRTTADGRFLLVQNATPASSVSVVDLKARKFVAEVPTPGCWIVIPSTSAASRFSTLCGDGTLLTFTLDGEGKVASQKRSKPFFDPDQDPIFVQAENLGDRHFFVSFQGNIHVADLSAEEARFEPAWPLAPKGEAKQNWRPGGYQPLALHAKSGRLFVSMHPKGGEGSHKTPAKEIWVIDVAAKKRVARVPGQAAISITVSQDDKPLLFGLDGEKMALVVWNAAARPALKGRLEPFAETAFFLETH
jgi:methylamine dehydrogenase heavy chain